MVDTCSSSLHERPMGTISQDFDVEKGKVPYSTQHLLAQLMEKDENNDHMQCNIADLKALLFSF